MAAVVQKYNTKRSVAVLSKFSEPRKVSLRKTKDDKNFVERTERKFEKSIDFFSLQVSFKMALWGIMGIVM